LFRRALRNPKRFQSAIRRALLRKNQNTAYGQRHYFEAITDWEAFQKLPLTHSDDYQQAIEQIMSGETQVLTQDSVQVLQPTSGTSSAPKLIPFNNAMGAEFRNGLDPWIADLILRYPALLLGPQYWSISPATHQEYAQESAVPVGFLDDIDYFGRTRRWLMCQVLAVPADVRKIPGMEANLYVTVLFLLRVKHLRLISVWHPSFLQNLLEMLTSNWDRLLSDIKHGGIDERVELPANLREKLSRKLGADPKRHRELEVMDGTAIDICRHVWPHMQVISCWSQSQDAPATVAIQRRFPTASIQAKGLLATEGIVTIPFGSVQAHVCAATSHILEFMDQYGVVHPLWELTKGGIYKVILTTAAGHYRYQLGDRVEVTGYIAKAPCLRFLGRAGIVSDCVGEKVHLEHVEAILDDIRSTYALQDLFMMLVPVLRGGNHRYVLLLEGRSTHDQKRTPIATSVEKLLCANYHYRHARNLRQLDAADVQYVAESTKRKYQAFMVAKGAAASTIKFPALCIAPEVVCHLLSTESELQYV
jgi:hypothetical protein